MIGLRVAVVGGGLAGIAAALECADAGGLERQKSQVRPLRLGIPGGGFVADVTRGAGRVAP